MLNETEVAGIVLDTSAAIDLMDERDGAPSRRADPQRPRGSDGVRDAQEWVLPVPVVGELAFGALNSTRRGTNTAKVDAFVSRCRVVDSTVMTARVYAGVRHVLSQAGNLIPENDLWIAASTLEAGLPLATSDPHFDSVPGLDLRRP